MADDELHAELDQADSETGFLSFLAAAITVTAFVPIGSAALCVLVRFCAVTRVVTVRPCSGCVALWIVAVVRNCRSRSQRGGHEFEPRAVHQTSTKLRIYALTVVTTIDPSIYFD